MYNSGIALTLPEVRNPLVQFLVQDGGSSRRTDH